VSQVGGGDVPDELLYVVPKRELEEDEVEATE